MDQQNKKNPIIPAIVAIAVIAILVTGVIVFTGKDKEESTNSTEQVSQNTTPETQADSTALNEQSTSSTTGIYKDGTYQASGSYNSPGGTEEVDVELTIADNTITAANVTPKAASPTSKQYQSQFVAGYKSQVVGKNVDEVKLSKVSGSSLTSQGFNDALAEIRSKAKS